MSVDHAAPIDPTSAEVEERHNAYPGGLLFPESEIQALAGDLSESLLLLLRAVLDAMSEPEMDGLDATTVSLIRRLAENYGEEPYRRLMSCVVKAIEEGPVGVIAAYKTVRRVIELLQTRIREESVVKAAPDAPVWEEPNWEELDNEQ